MVNITRVTISHCIFCIFYHSYTGLDCIDGFRKASGPNACEVKPHSKPWIARVREERDWCGGALISHSHVISAAHCFNYCRGLLSNPSERMIAILGDHDTRKIDTGEVAVGIKDIKCHPKYLGSPRGYFQVFYTVIFYKCK